MYHGLMEAPVYAQAGLLFLHTPFTLAAMQRAGQEGRHRVGALVPGAGAQLHAAVAGHTLTQGPQTWTASLIARAQVPGHQAVFAGQNNL